METQPESRVHTCAIAEAYAAWMEGRINKYAYEAAFTAARDLNVRGTR